MLGILQLPAKLRLWISFSVQKQKTWITQQPQFFLWIPNVLLSQGRTLGAMLVSRGQHRLLHGVYYVLKNPLDWLESKIVELMIWPVYCRWERDWSRRSRTEVEAKRKDWSCSTSFENVSHLNEKCIKDWSTSDLQRLSLSLVTAPTNIRPHVHIYSSGCRP